jgi:hypothetical protein
VLLAVLLLLNVQADELFCAGSHSFPEINRSIAADVSKNC